VQGCLSIQRTQGCVCFCLLMMCRTAFPYSALHSGLFCLPEIAGLPFHTAQSELCVILSAEDVQDCLSIQHNQGCVSFCLLKMCRTAFPYSALHSGLFCLPEITGLPFHTARSELCVILSAEDVQDCLSIQHNQGCVSFCLLKMCRTAFPYSALHSGLFCLPEIAGLPFHTARSGLCERLSAEDVQDCLSIQRTQGCACFVWHGVVFPNAGTKGEVHVLVPCSQLQLEE